MQPDVAAQKLAAALLYDHTYTNMQSGGAVRTADPKLTDGLLHEVLTELNRIQFEGVDCHRRIEIEAIESISRPSYYIQIQKTKNIASKFIHS